MFTHETSDDSAALLHHDGVGVRRFHRGVDLVGKEDPQAYLKPDNSGKRLSINLALLQFLPGMMLTIACCVPLFYFNSRLKKETHCINVIQFNRMHKSAEDIRTLIEDFECTGLDIDELFERAELSEEIAE